MLNYEIIEETGAYCNIHITGEAKTVDDILSIQRKLKRAIATKEMASESQILTIKSLLDKVEVDMVKFYDTFKIKETYEEVDYDTAEKMITMLAKKYEIQERQSAGKDN